jgi:hypothetical protein
MRASHFIYIVVALTAFAAPDLRFNRDNALADFSQGIQLNPKLFLERRLRRRVG